ncbi:MULTISPECIES: hypothetical protein [unclassified Pseudomonas]|uniref:hypothetical protein n=1 Tax=unclassified Pseudomonas TaxID=196821 RepID=UPI0025FE25C7|nr:MULTISPECIES: hypothetical protein [unclassified Pseudomonas]
MKNYFLSPQAMSQAFDSVTFNLPRRHIDTTIALLTTLRLDNKDEPCSSIQSDWDAISDTAQTIRKMAQRRSGTALAHLLDQLARRLNSSQVIEFDREAVLMWPSKDALTQTQALDTDSLFMVNAPLVEAEGRCKTDRYLYIDEADTGVPVVLTIRKEDVQDLVALQIDEPTAFSAIQLKRFATKGLTLATYAERSPVDAYIVLLWVSSLLSGMTDRLFSYVKTLSGIHDPRLRSSQRDGTRMQACLAHIDALLLSQELALRDILKHAPLESSSTANVCSNAQRVCASALEAGNLILRTLRELHSHDELHPITRQVQAITAVCYLAELGNKPWVSPDLLPKERFNG